MSIFTKIFGDANKRAIDKAMPTIEKINQFEGEFSPLKNEELKNKTEELKTRIKKGESMDDVLPEAFALVRESSKRTLKQRHYDVQLIGGIILHSGKITEMRTGEGKTLVATLPTYLNALTGDGVHVVTVNDYLSRRDAVWMGQIYDLLGLTVGCLNNEASYIYDKNYKQTETADETRDQLGSFKVVHEFLKPCSKKEAYEADITYGTNNEFGFDYLRDNIVYSKERLSQRGHNYAIVDEIDSILIDEARTPLIISAPAEESSDFYITFSKVASKLEEEKDYKIDEKLKAISLTQEGIEKTENLLGIKDIYTEKGIKYVHHLETAVRAKALFKKDKDYVVKDNQIIIVDEFTGRMMPGRRWSEGLHQAMEAKEGVSIQKETRTFASITFQNYFRMYKKVAGMTGTAETSAEEFFKVYKLETVAVPPNKPILRHDFQDQIYQSEQGKFKAVVEKIKELHQKKQPVLVGTVSIEKNEYLSALLKKDGVPHNVLNAKNHEAEGEIIAQAGKIGGVTIATNMAGRGVDIVLGGNPPVKEDMEEIKKVGGLFVLGTERHEARRIDNQLRGRAGRQGDPGESQFFVSMEDELMRIFGSDRMKGMMTMLKIPEDQAIENNLISKALETAQTKIEGLNFDARKHLLDYDDVLNHQRKIIYDRRKNVLLGDNSYIEESLKNIFEDFNLNKEDLEKRKKELGEEVFYGSQRALMLQAIDTFWMDHLESMDYLRSSVRLRAYGQKDPLVEYKNEGIMMFRRLENAIDSMIAEFAIKMAIQPARGEIKINNDKPKERNVGRNDPCPCGSGKKYKKCCGK